jgi:hypothetical protein
MPSGAITFAVGLGAGLLLAHFLGSEGGRDAIMIALALVAGLALAKYGVV